MSSMCPGGMRRGVALVTWCCHTVVVVGVCAVVVGVVKRWLQEVVVGGSGGDAGVLMKVEGKEAIGFQFQNMNSSHVGLGWAC
jgi:hypothetical protein